MIIVDTNVVSELMKPEPEPGVIAWVDGQADLFITAITSAELLNGVGHLPEGQRRARIAEALAVMLETSFADRVVAFDLAASAEYARIVVARDQAGTPIGMADAMIAAIAIANDADAVATRNVKDFDGTGVFVVDPWAAV